MKLPKVLRAFAVLLTSALILSLSAEPVAGNSLLQDGDSLPPVTEDKPHSANEYLYQELSRSAEEIILFDFKIHTKDIGKLYADLLNNSPELFYVDGRLSYSYDADSTVIAVRPCYRSSGDTLKTERELYARTVAELTEGITDNMKDAEKALLLHDRIISRFDYDTEYKNYDALSMFRDGVGVCQAYALAYIATCRAVGLKADFVASEEMRHAWNTVCIDGKYYHADLTHDDPIITEKPSDERLYVVRHEAFLRSDAGMAALGYVGYTAERICNDTSFEREDGRGVLENIHGEVKLYDGIIYAIDEERRVLRLDFVSDCNLTPLPRSDANGDGTLDLFDLIHIRKYIDGKEEHLSPATLPENFYADSTCDGEDILCRTREYLLESMLSDK